jgi:hypothetical protein
MTHHWRLAAIGGIVLVLAACAPPHAGPPDNGVPATSNVGIVFLSETDTEDGTFVDGMGVFMEVVSDEIPADFLDAPFFGDRIGQCLIEGFDEPIPGDPFEDFEPGDWGLPFTDYVRTLDAGETLTVEAEGETFVTFTRLSGTENGDVMYWYFLHDDTDVDGLVPGMTLTVPGGEIGEGFPAFANVALPDVAAFELIAPTPDGFGVVAVDETTEFTWEASGEADTVVILQLVSDDFGLGVTCIADDADGEFTLPEETVTELGGAFDGYVESACRVAGTVDTEGDSSLLVMTASAQEFTTFDDEPINGVPLGSN